VRATACAARCRGSRDKAASVFLGTPLVNRTLFDRIKLALKFIDHQLEPLAQRGINHRGAQAFGAGVFGKAYINVRHDFHKCGALAPRNRSANQNAQIATKERTKIPPHARKVDAKLVVMTSSESSYRLKRALRRRSQFAMGTSRPFSLTSSGQQAPLVSGVHVRTQSTRTYTGRSLTRRS